VWIRTVWTHRQGRFRTGTGMTTPAEACDTDYTRTVQTQFVYSGTGCPVDVPSVGSSSPLPGVEHEAAVESPDGRHV
jgi:hypothetical protein